MGQTAFGPDVRNYKMHLTLTHERRFEQVTKIIEYLEGIQIRVNSTVDSLYLEMDFEYATKHYVLNIIQFLGLVLPDVRDQMISIYILVSDETRKGMLIQDKSFPIKV